MQRNRDREFATLTQRCVERFGLLATSGHHWLIAADWLEEAGAEVAAAAFREGIWVLDSQTLDDNGDGRGNGYAIDRSFFGILGKRRHAHYFGNRHYYGNGHGLGNGTGDGFGKSFGDRNSDGNEVPSLDLDFSNSRGSGCGGGFGDGNGLG